MSFRTFSPKANYLDRDQINELSTIDSLIGIVFKSYQEKVKWDKTTVIVLTDGNAAHKYSETEIYKQTPIIIKGPSIPEFQEPNNIIAIDDVLSLIGDILNVNCNDSIIPISKNIFTSADSSINNSIKKEFFVSRPDILIYPVLNRNQIDIELLADNESANLYYTINGDDPKTNGILYKDLIQIKEAGVFLIKAVTKYNSEWSSVTVQKAVLRNNLQSIEADPMPDPKYTFDGLDELVDLDTGNLSYAEDKWLGFQGKDVVFTFNFGAKRIINSIDISALQDYDSWIFLPNKITIFVGDDKSKMFEVGSVTHVSLKTDQRNIKKHFVIPITSDFLAKLSSTYIKKKRRQKSLYVKYLTVKIEANKTAPEWFTLPGAQTWFFTDEIKIE
ncbi:MAG: chitobiase/beta-hexosaminidase C-terminal domain-containing protein [Saprospiraceae bacterium]|nr:chitobiase/beta-hexosaminidase C-terminal domain-containing protein [Candidatus Brachybacter algidus]